MNTNKRLNKMTKVAALAAIAGVLMLLEFPIVPMFSWLKVDFSELPVLMGAFAYGPIVGIVIEAIKIVIKFLLSGSSSFGVGELANFLMGLAFILPASMIYHRNKTKKTAIIGMIVGVIVVNIVSIISNVYLLLPAYGMKMTGSAITKYILIGLLPVNTIKAVSVSLLTYILYKKISMKVFKVDSRFSSDDTNKELETKKTA